MMSRLANDPNFIVALVALVSALAAYIKARSSEVEQRATDKSIDRVAQAAGATAAQVTQHSAQIAALQASGDGRQPSVVPAAVAPVAPPALGASLDAQSSAAPPQQSSGA